MSTQNALPLYSFEPGSLPAIRNPVDDYDSDDERPGSPRRWYHYVPLCGEYSIVETNHLCTYVSQAAVLLLLAPHPSILHVLLHYHYLTLHATRYFLFHLLVIYSLSFLAFSSLIVCVARDPGPVPDAQPAAEVQQEAGGEISLEDALLSTPPEDYTQPGKWCRICWRPKPERAHHCSQCGRCVLKMGELTRSIAPTTCRTYDGAACRSPLPLDGCKMHRAHLPCVDLAKLLTPVQGFRTYPSFLHFLASVTLLAAYIATICIRGLIVAFREPLAMVRVERIS